MDGAKAVGGALVKLAYTRSAACFGKSSISDFAVRPVVIVLLDPTSDRCSRFFQAAILGCPDFLLFQAAMEPFDLAVSFRLAGI